ncbi:hypothetical protein PCANC_19599 [Puccinia coronata f. sp. avenae]|uniref:Uncharacterized protein n=1 Tax=Puccinia coronata f. sp. avenae TaxID=200324 RepID=A0A2N5SP55_9BASI|nr:hypothetical protein PCANC_19599 [Puccinia coronata f. sp. avenae]
MAASDKNLDAAIRARFSGSVSLGKQGCTFSLGALGKQIPGNINRGAGIAPQSKGHSTPQDEKIAALYGERPFPAPLNNQIKAIKKEDHPFNFGMDEINKLATEEIPSAKSLLPQILI